jgi:hypothetical protein
LVGNKDDPMGREVERSISDEKNVPARLKEIIETALDDEEGHEGAHCEEEDTGATKKEDTGAAEEKGDDQCYEDNKNYEDNKKASLCHYERTAKSEMFTEFIEPVFRSPGT